jgi:hypothetical protein
VYSTLPLKKKEDFSCGGRKLLYICRTINDHYENHPRQTINQIVNEIHQEAEPCCYD